MKTKLFFLALWLFAISCNNDDRMSDSTIISQTKYSYDSSKNLILIKGKKSDVKNLVYSEKSSFLENSYEKGFIPLLVSSDWIYKHCFLFKVHLVFIFSIKQLLIELSIFLAPLVQCV